MNDLYVRSVSAIPSEIAPRKKSAKSSIAQLCLKDRWDSGEIACERSAGNRFFSDMPTLPHCPDFPVGHVV